MASKRRLPKKPMNFYVASPSKWFVVSTRTKRQARSVGVAEFGRGLTHTVRPASQEETQYFISLKGKEALQP
jgi:hypothetical protein